MSSVNHKQFSSIDQLQAGLRAIWEVDITQSEPGPVRSSLWSTQVGDCLVFGSAANRSLVFSGRRAEQYWTVTPITRHCAGGRFRGQTLDEGDLLLLDPGGEVFMQTIAGHVQQAISIPVAVAERIIQAEYHDKPETLLQRWSWKSIPGAAARLEKMLQHFLAGSTAPSVGGESDATELAARVIAVSQAGTAPQGVRTSLANRRRVVSRAEELIRSRLHQPPSVTELCEATFASRRLLFYAFNELLGRSPAAHTKILRLHAARRRILAAGHSPSVQQIAYELGFRHPGQFAIDYGRAFGERPSQTRRRMRWHMAGGPTDIVLPLAP